MTARVHKRRRAGPRPPKSKKRWNLRGTEELTVCESGWSLGIKGAGRLAGRRRGRPERCLSCDRQL
jgi:hypothetical protein